MDAKSLDGERYGSYLHPPMMIQRSRATARHHENLGPAFFCNRNQPGPKILATSWLPSLVPISAVRTSPRIPEDGRVAWALAIRTAKVSAYFR